MQTSLLIIYCYLVLLIKLLGFFLLFLDLLKEPFHSYIWFSDSGSNFKCGKVSKILLKWKELIISDLFAKNYKWTEKPLFSHRLVIPSLRKSNLGEVWIFPQWNLLQSRRNSETVAFCAMVHPGVRQTAFSPYYKYGCSLNTSTCLCLSFTWKNLPMSYRSFPWARCIV